MQNGGRGDAAERATKRRANVRRIKNGGGGGGGGNKRRPNTRSQQIWDVFMKDNESGRKIRARKAAVIGSDLDQELTTSNPKTRILAVDNGMKGDSDCGGRDGVKVWLNELGLGKYGALFDVHEVEDEVLPLLTLEDLKDMGVHAVGTRTKMYRSIQKLNGKGSSG